MENTIGNALFLLAIGMITVFVILLLVILCGTLLITIVNKYFPENTTPSDLSKEENAMKVLEQIVAKVTDSKGIIEKVEKL